MEIAPLTGVRVLVRPARLWSDAVRSALDEGRSADAAALVTDSWRRYVISDPALVRVTIRALPTGVWQADPWLLTGLACTYYSAAESVERATSTLYFAEAKRQLAVHDAEREAAHPAAAGSAGSDAHPHDMMARLVFAVDQRHRGRFERAHELLERLREDLERDRSAQFDWRIGMEVRLRLERSILDWHRAAFDHHESSIGPALAMAREQLLPDERVRAYGTAALYALLNENYPQVQEWVDRAFAAADAAEHPDDPSEIPLRHSAAAAPAVFALALMELDRGNFDRAAELAPDLDGAVRGTEWRSYSALVTSMTLLVRGRPSEALEPLRLARQLAHRWTGAHLLDSLTYVIRVGIEAALGRNHPAEKPPGAQLDDARHLFCSGRYSGWLFIGQGRHEEAIGAVAECLRLGEMHSRGSLIEALLVDSTARAALGDESRSASSFDYAMLLCADSGFRRALYHLPPVLLGRMVTAAIARPQPPRVSELLLELSDSLSRDDGPLARLSEREQEILIGLGAGRSLRELSQQFFISHNTIKTHVRHIYRKLGVGSRSEALVAARLSGDIPPASARSKR
ncbi:response regulator transcription factor [Herbiconiux sp. YIM B11900]|uniref:helix-turn-helix transcriptional regulator n=1 Tax=Herbiconiux sp. YIM B11900 TaxID=3404131 RepID=UPI003F8669AF